MSIPVTILMSVHNGLPYVEETVRSVLAQTHREFEFLILDDASTDGTVAYLRTLTDPRIRLLSLTENIGLTAALNRGLREARGEIIARQDADDLSHPRRLELQLAFLQAHPRCAAVGSQARLLNAQGGSLGKKDFPLGHHGLRFAHLFDNALAHTAVTFLRAEVLALGGYDETWTASQDYELWSRLSAAHELANLPERLVSLRVLASSITRQHKRPELIRRVQAAHYERLLGRPPTEAELDLIALFRSRVEPDRLPGFRALLTQLTAACESASPGATTTPDFRRTLSMIHERVGYNLLAVSRRAGLGELMRALRVRPAAFFTLPWLRIGALAVLGDSARRLYEGSRK